MNETRLCPFSKPLIGQWCQCAYASLAERCSGKMVCSQSERYLDSCSRLVDLFRDNARFVLGLGEHENQLTHTQLMKIRCGGLRGMQRIMQLSTQAAPVVRDVIEAAEQQYGSIAAFPFNEIVQDIRVFSHRNKKRD